MRFSLWLKELERKRIISRHPHPLFLFIFTLLILFLGTQMYPFNVQGAYLLFALGVFTFIFSVLHWLVWMILERPKQRIHYPSGRKHRK